MGSVYSRHDKYWLKFRDAAGEPQRRPTKFRVSVAGDEERAGEALKAIEDAIAAQREYVEDDGDTCPVTLARFVKKWIEKRKALNIANAENEGSVLRDHVLRRLGSKALGDVRARDLAALFMTLRTGPSGPRKKMLAPKSIRNIYAILRALFRDAQIDGLIASSPCILTKYQLGDVVDKDPEARAGYKFSREELERLISDTRIPFHRRVLYALMGVEGMRPGEASALCWRHLEPNMKPLGRLTIARSNEKKRTKTGTIRYAPVHPTLAALLAEWRLSGWAGIMGRQPTPDDLIVPAPAPKRGRQVGAGRMRVKGGVYDRLQEDLELLGLRKRRAYDFRHTGVSLPQDDGARQDIVRLWTHGPSRSKVIAGYTHLEWKTICEEMLKFRVQRREPGQVISMSKAAVAGGGDEGGEGEAEPNSVGLCPEAGTALGTAELNPKRFPVARNKKGRAVHPGLFPSEVVFLCFQTTESACPVARAAVSRVSHPS
jgi:integrase